MASAIPSDPRSGTARGRAILFVASILAVVLIGSMSLVSRRTSPGARAHELDVRSPYRNTRPGVKYVGDAACTRCHAEIARTYRSHPMGRSLAPIDAAAPGPDGTGDGRPLFEAQGLEYSVAHRDGRVFHQETRRDSAGRVVARNEAEVQFVVGSGRQAFAYLIEHDGFLFQSPITWYAQKRRWDLAPGYEKVNLHFHRPAAPGCLYCHANRVEPVAGTVNRYRPPLFRGHAIGCERCHGPGELHVALPPLVDGKDMTIVNPANLEPALRDAVCEQCHLNGVRRVLRIDRRDEDYRPGLPFHQIWSVFEPPAGTGGNRVVGQFEQMYESRCYRASQGQFWCVSCHDPHQQPAPAEKVAYYRGRCLECHADRGCSLAAETRLQRSREDDCAGCHMPRTRSTDVIHTATTDHRVLRHGNEEQRSPTVADHPRGDPRSLVHFHHDLMSDRERRRSRTRHGHSHLPGRAGWRGDGVAIARGRPGESAG